MLLRGTLFLCTLFFVGANAQIDTVEVKKQYSLFSENAKTKTYQYCKEPYHKIVKNFPYERQDLMKNFFYYGKMMWKNDIDMTKDEALKSKYVDSLIALYDLQIKAIGINSKWGNLGEVKGYKVSDISIYRKDNIDEIIALTRDILNTEKENSLANVMNLYMKYSVILKNQGKLTCDDIINVYNELSGYIDYNLARYEKDHEDTYSNMTEVSKKDSIDAKGNEISEYTYKLKDGKTTIKELYRNDTLQIRTDVKTGKEFATKFTFYSRAQESVNKAAGPCLTCESLVEIFKKNYEKNKEDATWLNKAATTMFRKECYKVEKLKGDATIIAIFTKNVEKNPSGTSYKNLGSVLLYFGEEDKAIAAFDKSLDYSTDNEEKAKILFTIAQFAAGKGNYTQARNYCLKAVALKKNWGAPYLLIGDMYAGSMARVGGDNEVVKRAVFCAAVDKYSYAKQIDPSIEAIANKKIGVAAAHYPKSADAFMYGVSCGSSYTVGGWIGETTTIRCK